MHAKFGGDQLTSGNARFDASCFYKYVCHAVGDRVHCSDLLMDMVAQYDIASSFVDFYDVLAFFVKSCQFLQFISIHVAAIFNEMCKCMKLSHNLLQTLC